MSKHTPIPWSRGPAHPGDCNITGPEGWHIATTHRLLGGYANEGSENEDMDAEEMEANADMIVRAVNSHEELLEALEKIAPLIGDVLGRLRFSVPADASILPTIAAAIAKAKGVA